MNQDDERDTAVHREATRSVRADSHLTLHYRISLADSGNDVISTFGDRPATLTLGLGQLVESLERCLIGMAEGEEAAFELQPEQAFGPRNPQLLQRLSRSLLDRHGDPAEPLAPGDLLDFPAPGGGRYAGVLKEIDERGALVDFNHPLAGHPIRFEVRILGVL
jgi:FKBP-type peptidyl-prolyl cis-trans isomerase SlpA